MNGRSRYQDMDDESFERWLAKVRFANLDPSKIPVKFLHLMNLAQEWGIDDDGLRDFYVHKASDQTLKALVSKINETESLEEWLAGSEAYSGSISQEYAAYTCLLMAYDHAKSVLTWRKEDREKRDKLQLKLPLKEMDENGS